MSSRPKLALLGGGHMGEALVGGLIASRWADEGELAVVEPSAPRREALAARWPRLVVGDAPVEADGVVIAVRPPDVETACRGAAAAGVRRALSIAAGVRLAKLESWLGEGVAVVRAMPNTPAAVGLGAAAIAAGSSAGDADMDWADSILSAVGIVVRVPEELLDVVTGLSGSGPAYVYLVAEAMAEAGAANGLPGEVAVALATQTLAGAARYLVESGETAASLRAAVATPGGTTEAGLRALEERGLREAFLAAISAASERARELGG